MLVKIDHNKNNVNFHFQPKKKQLNSWAKKLNVLEFSKLKIFGTVSQRTKSRWELACQLNFEVIQECVVTLDPVTTHLTCLVKRVYLENYSIENNQNSAGKLQDSEYERLEDTIDLINLIFEELSLNIPEYPKLKHIEKSQTVLAETYGSDLLFRNNPFHALKNFEVKNKIKTN